MTQQEQELWSQYTLTRSIQSRNALAERYRNLVTYCAGRIWSGAPRRSDLDDMISEGMFGLFDAIARFEPGRGIEFTTYASNRIRGHILDWLRSVDHVSRLTRSRARRLEAAVDSLRASLSREPTRREVAERLQLSEDRANEFFESAQVPGVSSISNRVYRGETRDGILADCIGNRRPDRPEASTAQKEMVEKLLRGLRSEERLIVVLYYLEELRMKQIGQAIGISESRVSQLLSNILLRLRAQCDVRCAARS